jgi:hypothetical protein
VFNPTGRATRRFRLRETDETGAELTVSGNGVVVRIGTDAASRRAFGRFCDRNGILAQPVAGAAENNETYNKRTGERVAGCGNDVPYPTVFQCVGQPGFHRLLKYHCSAVLSVELAMSVRPPRGARPDQHTSRLPKDIPQGTATNLRAARSERIARAEDLNVSRELKTNPPAPVEPCEPDREGMAGDLLLWAEAARLMRERERILTGRDRATLPDDLAAQLEKADRRLAELRAVLGV